MNARRRPLVLVWLRRPRWRRRVQAARTLIAVVASIAFVGIGPAPANAEEEVDQVVGSGNTTSALTVSWKDGLLGADNRTVVAPRDPASPYAFMHSDFEDLTVSVSQTQHIVHQAIVVKWSGGQPTEPPFKASFLQLMQCYGDAFTGPDPEGCQFGSAGLLQPGVINSGIGTRAGSICATPAPSTTDPPGTKDGSAASVGCDPSEPRGDTHIQPCPTGEICIPGTYSIPFVPAGTEDKIYGQVTEFYDQFNTNEVQQASTGADGTGEQSFQTLTATQAPGLGCGLITGDGKSRECWLVIVPRGTYEPNGWKLNGSSGIPGFVNESPLGAATWAQRIQIHLGFNNVPTNCAIGSAKELPLVGTELVARAVFSWQVALNAAANCRTIFGYAATSEPVNTTQLGSADGAGLAFTTIPIGSEVTRAGGAAGPDPPVVYAPVAVSAITFGFHINQSTGLVTSHIKLTPRLMAKALTQSYRYELPDVDSAHPGPDWAKANPDFITRDPEFQRLNPGINTPPAGLPRAPLLTEDHSALNQQVWRWVVADPVARVWLAGKPDEDGMVVNPHYKNLRLGQAAIDSYPRADPTCFQSGNAGERVPRCSLDLLPYMHNLDDTATRIRAANNPMGAAWDPLKLAPDGQAGWWSNGGVEPAGQIFLWGVTSSADVANLGLVPADLCTSDGSTCVAPSTASVAKALSTAKADAAGLVHVNPRAAGADGYPLVTVTYAAVRIAQSAEALRDYASLILFASGSGQTPGAEPGLLPRGYLPLPAKMRAEARTAVARLIASTRPTSGPPPSTAAPPPVAPPTPVPSDTGPAPLGYTTTRLAAVPVRYTPLAELGPVRWALLVIVAVGLFGAAGGPVLRRIGRRAAVRWWRR